MSIWFVLILFRSLCDEGRILPERPSGCHGFFCQEIRSPAVAGLKSPFVKSRLEGAQPSRLWGRRASCPPLRTKRDRQNACRPHRLAAASPSDGGLEACAPGPFMERDGLRARQAKAKGTFNPATAGPLNVPLPNELLNVLPYGGVGREVPTLDFTRAMSEESIAPLPFTSSRKLGGLAADPDCDLVRATSEALTEPLPFTSPINKPKVTAGLMVFVPSDTLFSWMVMYWALQLPADRLTTTWWLSAPIAAVAVPQVDVTPPTDVIGFVKLKLIV